VPVIDKRWGRLKDATELTGLSRSEVYRLIGAGLIKSFLYTLKPDAKSGIRLIDLPQLAAYLDQRAEAAMAEEAAAKAEVSPNHE
jgi:hypothetical protein